MTTDSSVHLTLFSYFSPPNFGQTWHAYTLHRLKPLLRPHNCYILHFIDFYYSNLCLAGGDLPQIIFVLLKLYGLPHWLPVCFWPFHLAFSVFYSKVTDCLINAKSGFLNWALFRSYVYLAGGLDCLLTRDGVVSSSLIDAGSSLSLTASASGRTISTSAFRSSIKPWIARRINYTIGNLPITLLTYN